jgi:alkane 1-monooxygenase
MTNFEFLTFTLIFGNIGIISMEHSHELIHKKSKIGRFIGQVDFVKNLYMHIYSEHVKGHHRWVCTPLDKGTSTYGQSFYDFFPKSFFNSYTCTWDREVLRLQKEGRSKFSLYNKMITWTLCEILFTYSVYHFYDSRVLLFFVSQAFVSITILEIFNYFTHYGLTRKKLPNGEYEPVQPKHSWSAHQLIQNVIQLGVQRHPDHHANAHRPYQILRASTDGPAYPCGYLTCTLIALLPPVWFKMTHPIIEGFNKDGKANDQQKNTSKNVFLMWMVVQATFTSIAPFLF